MREISIRSLNVEPEGWGRSKGAMIQRALIARLGHDHVPEVIRLSLQNLNRLDVTFAAEVIAEPVRRYLGIKSICVVHAHDSDVAETSRRPRCASVSQ